MKNIQLTTNANENEPVKPQG